MVNPPANLSGNGGHAVLSNFKMRIHSDNAWVSHDEVSISKDGKEAYSQEFRMLEKVNNQWKLVGQSNHSYTPVKQDTTSYIQIFDMGTGATETVWTIKDHFEAPNWHPDNYLIVNSKGKLYTLDLATKKLTELNTGFATACNNDHGISPDKKWLIISHNDKNDPSPKAYKSAIYILPIKGGEPRRVTSEVMSFWHGWTPDGKTLAYCAERNGNFDIYTIGTEGGKEKRLTDTEGLDDGPDYSPDGKYIYFNSYRTGHMQIWRMLADGSKPEQLTFDDNSNWFAHPSPDNKWIVYISYLSDEKQAHLFGKNVKLRLMNLETKVIKDITPVFYGGQGTINVPSWSPDSKKIAFVSYSVK
jgi:Tol biopolymer transport system component